MVPTPASLLFAVLAAVPPLGGGTEAAGPPVGGAPQLAAAAPDAAVQSGGLSLDQAVAMVQRRYNAKVVRADESREGDDVVYVIRLLSPDGRVFTVRVNARTGQAD
jgi:uncharacterized membrane protein YkoI